MQFGLRLPMAISAWLMVALLGGCASHPATKVVLLPQADGSASGVTIQSGQQPRQTLNQPYQRLVVQGNLRSTKDQTDAEAVRQQFPTLFSSMPAPSSRSVLLFQNGDTVLTPASESKMVQVRDEALSSSGAELVVIGHTDTVGAKLDNDELSLRRAKQVRELLVQAGFPAERIETVGRGERELAVATPDETPEPRNRRVEILRR